MSLKYVHETCKQNADLLEGFFSFKKKKKATLVMICRQKLEVFILPHAYGLVHY